jgi:Zn-dependent protease
MPSFVADGNSVVVKVILLLISINFSFAVFNVLPIPPLDGYRICELSVSKLFKKKIPDKFEITVTLIGITLIV